MPTIIRYIKIGFLKKKNQKDLYVEKPRIKRLKIIDLLHELPLYDELSIEKVSKAFQIYAKSYKIEIIDSTDSLSQ